MFTGLSAFPLTPISEEKIDEKSYISLIKRLVNAQVNSIGALGSTGNYAYLDLQERIKVARLTMEHARDIPVIIGTSALRTKDVLFLAKDAEQIGASAVLLSPFSYQNLTDREVFTLYKTVNDHISIPICLYDNPRTTHFHFSDQLYAEIAQLSNVKSIKIPGVPNELEEAKERIATLRALLPSDVTLGVSGDAYAATGLIAGCDLWYSVIGGLYPYKAKMIADLVKDKKHQQAEILSNELNDLWQYFSQYGSLRVIATAAEIDQVVQSPCLPSPLKSLEGQTRTDLATLLARLKLR